MVVALNKSDVTEKKQTKIDEKLLSEKLGCPVVKTVSTSSGHEDLKEVVRQAAALRGQGQKAPYVQADIDLHDKAAVEAADRKRFEFVNSIVKDVEKRTVFTKDKNFQDKIDAVITHKVIGIPIFAGCDVSGILYFPVHGGNLDRGLAGGLHRGFPGHMWARSSWRTPTRSGGPAGDGIVGGVGAGCGFLRWLG